MREERERDNHQHNAIYYNQMLRENEKKDSKKVPKKEKTFAKKEVVLSDYLIVPQDYEGIVYALYLIIIPYIVGLVFLFFYVANGAYESFSLLNLNAFLIIWAIGYEITAAILLVIIFIAYIKFLKNSR